MKTSNNNQETSNGQVSKMTLRTAVVLVSVVLVSFSVSAQDFWKEITNTVAYGKMTLTLDEQSDETKNADDAINALYSELAVLWNNTSESAAKVNAEESAAVENEMAIENFLNEAEQQTAAEADVEIAKYDQKLMTAAEKEERLTVENGMTDEAFFQDAEQQTAEGTAFEIAKYAEKIMQEKEAKKEVNLDNGMTNEAFLQDAELQTAQSTDSEMARYAEKIMAASQNQETLASENNTTIDNFFRDAEQYTAEGSDAQIAHYAKALNNKETLDNTTAFEHLGMYSENLNN